ncbi:Peptidase M60, enhancin and enhancin-like [Pedobacter terrae]|uniref:Peptidase M60, enhancin and enhancin-like n=1 Tax=Pedobacter terrae TaxID=405671 RepID=A0A1G8E5D4_9SPHI|nr:M60 family metallopeptidase [Pedobacter terrae]SDH65113.1 Peptidase M60, enhancin and enhancin-like [Pedobacter terrae]
MNLKTALLSILVCFATQSFAQKFQKSALLKGINTLPMPDTGKFVSAFFSTNEEPHTVATHLLSSQVDVLATVMMSSTLGKGQIFAIGSSEYFESKLLSDQNVQKLLKNIIQAASTQPKKLKVAVTKTADAALINALKANKAKVYIANANKLQPKTDIYFLTNDVKDTTQLKVLEKYIAGGGNLVYASPYPYIFKHRNPNKSYINDLIKINALLSKAGIFNAYTLFTAEHAKDSLTLTKEPFYLLLKNILSELAKSSPKATTPTEYAYGIEPTLDLTFSNNADTSRMIGKIKSILSISDSLPIPTLKNPIDISTAAKKAGYQFSKYLFDKSHNTKKSPYFIYPESKSFPGEVPKNAKRSTEIIDMAVKVGSQGLADPYPNYFRLHSTGVYVPAGEKVSIVIDPKYKTQYLKAQIGIHNDDLKHMDNLVRSGFDLTRSFELEKDTTTVFSPYGGLLYIRIPDSSSLQSISIIANGVVKAPYYKLEKNNLTEWASIKNNPAPWTELATDKIILTVPTYRIKTLENPESLLKLWDEIMDADADLAIISRTRTHPERIIIDNQVAYGYMFTVWDKIVAPNDESCEWMLNEKILKEKGSWGHFHELGHRHQFWGLDMDEVSEVTTNLYTMYVYDKVLKKGLYNHDGIANRDEVKKKVINYLQNEPNFEKWEKEPFTALCMYIQIIEHFGWESMIKANKIYREMDPRKYYENQLSNEQRIDLWFTSISKATHSNLSSFFEIWKIPVSKKAKTEAEKYKTWIPEEFSAYLPQ